VRTLEHAYKKAPFFDSVHPFLGDVLLSQEKNLARYIENSVRRICTELGIVSEILISSELGTPRELRGQDRVLWICEALGAESYINAPGGRALYSNEDFRRRGIELAFIDPRIFRYAQFGREFVPNLSIVDVMMFNSRERIAGTLSEYRVV